MGRKIPILSLCQTWMQADDKDLQQALDVHASTGQPHKYYRAVGGVALIINPIMPFEVIDKTIQPFVSKHYGKNAGMVVTVIYVSPKAKQCEEGTILRRLNKLSNSQAFIIGDLNARHRYCNKKETGREPIWPDLQNGTTGS